MYNRLWVILIPFIDFILLEVFFFSPKMIYVVASLIALSLFFVFWQFSRASVSTKDWWNFMVLPLLFCFGMMGYSTMLANKLFIQFLFFLYLFFIYTYIRSAYYYFVRPEIYESFPIDNISRYGNFLSFFFFSSAIYGLESFLNFSIWRLMLVLIVFTFLSFYQSAWKNKISFHDSKLYIIIGCLVITELAWAISFLPLDFRISGFVLSVIYYIIISFMVFSWFKNLNLKIVKKYLIFGVLILIVTLLTARWK